MASATGYISYSVTRNSDLLCPFSSLLSAKQVMVVKGLHTATRKAFKVPGYLIPKCKMNPR